ncbi:MAG: PepSY domain-containing protein [Stigonema ocellatum SAG 48.90 = DSM 106950]|nr:PepSY domain-containing protein [Stigonema ocellatum SAG 48.90 = DSM 106950]
MKFRKLVFNLHSIIGIVIGVFFVISGLTGSGIVFRSEADRILNAKLMQVTPQAEMQSIDRILTAGQQTHPDLRLQFIKFPQQREETYLISMKATNGERVETYVNPYTAKVLGSRVWERSLVGFLYTLHYSLFLGTPGRIAIGVFGILLLLSTLTGTLLWSGWRNIRTGFKIRTQVPTYLFNYDLHNVGGILTAVLLSLIAVTGSLIVLAQFVLGGGQTIAQPILTQTPVAMSQLLQRADAALPGGKISFVIFPEAQPRKILVRKKFSEQTTGKFDLSAVEIDRYQGTILKAEKVLKPNAVFKVLLTIADLHYGRFGGLATRIVYIFVGFAPLILFITGFFIWRDRRKRKDWQNNEKIFSSTH